ncbi:hypothetical protein DFJ73DRAFT_861327, partial [Zopfochytrium polystomum]
FPTLSLSLLSLSPLSFLARDIVFRLFSLLFLFSRALYSFAARTTPCAPTVANGEGGRTANVAACGNLPLVSLARV